MSSLFAPGVPDVVELVLPWPPSLNNLYVHTYSAKHDRVFKFPTRDATQYIESVHAIVLSEGKNVGLKGDLMFEMTLFPPNARRIDFDNHLKAILDALKNRDEGKPGVGVRIGVYGDDSQIKKAIVEIGPTVKDGKAKVRISTLGM